MKGDFTRLTFQREKHFSQVLRQQGRVTLDADENEQSAILLYQLRMLARDLLGPFAAPVDGGGFAASVDGDGLVLTLGRMYVDGILIENDADPYRVDDALLKGIRETQRPAWLYIDVWERHITSIEDDSIRETALGGPDTSTRAQVVWQVKSLPMFDAYGERIERLHRLDPNGTRPMIQDEIQLLSDGLDQITDELARFQKSQKNPPDATLCGRPGLLLSGLSQAHMAARVDPGAAPTDPCVLAPDAQYRGMENQLYRVEIHRAGIVGDADGPTFKWSRDNGSVVSRWVGMDGTDLIVSHGRGFAAGNWVELTDDVQELAEAPGTLIKLIKVEGNRLSVDASSAPTAWSAQLVNPKVRRWDQVQRDDVVLDDGAIPLTESGAPNTPITWLDLEDGIQIAFTPGGEYRTGDYWLIPARVATGAIEWPDSIALPPRGVEHHYAPLGFVWWDGEDLVFGGCRCEFTPGAPCGSSFHTSGPPAPIDLNTNSLSGQSNASLPLQAASETTKTSRRRKPR